MTCKNDLWEYFGLAGVGAAQVVKGLPEFDKCICVRALVVLFSSSISPINYQEVKFAGCS